MTGFSADWLALREPFDTQARDTAWPMLALPARAARWRAAQPQDSRLDVIDLACGSGANLRALAPRIGGAQRWRLIDHDPALLAVLPHAMAQWAQQQGYRIQRIEGREAALHIEGAGFSVELVCACIDLVRDLDTIDFGQARLVTASALLDLVSAAWLEALLRRTCASRAALLFALSVDGRTLWDPVDACDDAVHRLFSAHQRRDKGFGPALGPGAVPHACRYLEAAGYTVVQARSDWLIEGPGSSARAMQAAMIDGMAAAAIEQAPEAAGTVLDWKARRLASVGMSRLTVGHIDIMAEPGVQRAMAPGPDPTTGRGPLEPR